MISREANFHVVTGSEIADCVAGQRLNDLQLKRGAGGASRHAQPEADHGPQVEDPPELPDREYLGLSPNAVGEDLRGQNRLGSPGVAPRHEGDDNAATAKGSSTKSRTRACVGERPRGRREVARASPAGVFGRNTRAAVLSSWRRRFGQFDLQPTIVRRTSARRPVTGMKMQERLALHVEGAPAPVVDPSPGPHLSRTPSRSARRAA